MSTDHTDHNDHDDHDHAGHSHGGAAATVAAMAPHATRAFALALFINLGYTALEAGYGFAIDSLALLSDALHNLGDVLGLALAWGAAWLAQRPATHRHTYGWRRATLLSPLVNAVMLVAFSGALAWEAIRRFSASPAVPGMTIIVVASIGILVNLGAAWLLRGSPQAHGHAHGGGDLNRRAAFLHLMADAGVSLAAVLAGIGMLQWDLPWLDPLTALLVGVVIAVGSFGLLRDSFNATMDAVPKGLDRDAVEDWLRARPGVTAVHHLHIWPLGAGAVALTAHVIRPRDDDHDAFIAQACAGLAEGFGIEHATLQIERGEACADASLAPAAAEACADTLDALPDVPGPAPAPGGAGTPVRAPAPGPAPAAGPHRL